MRCRQMQIWVLGVVMCLCGGVVRIFLCMCGRGGIGGMWVGLGRHIDCGVTGMTGGGRGSGYEGRGERIVSLLLPIQLVESVHGATA